MGRALEGRHTYNGSPMKAHRWKDALVLLSLDLAAPFGASFGLPELGSEIQPVLRQFILALREETRAAGRAPSDLGTPALASIEEALDADVAGRVKVFVERLYHEVHTDQPQGSGWWLAFFFDLQGLVAPLPTTKQVDLQRLWTNTTDMTELDNLIAQVKSEPLSEWDLDMCSRHALDPEGSPSPFHRIEKALRMRRFLAFARSAVKLLDDDERELLRERAEQVLNRREVWMPGPLASLPVLVAGGPS